MKSIMLWLTKPPVDGPRSVLLLRLMIGGVFFWEGVLKFVYVNQGVGRFTKLGMPFPAFTADFVGCLEIVGGLLLVAGLLTRLIAIPFVIEMIVAMLSTKISLYLGTSLLPLPAAPPQIGFWAVLHEIRSDYAQIMVALYLLINGPGKWSMDALLDKLRTQPTIPRNSTYGLPRKKQLPCTQTLRMIRCFLLIPLLPACFALASAPTAFGVVPAPDGGYPGGNTAEGDNALFNLTTGTGNTAIGSNALFHNTTGRNNTAEGDVALQNNTTGINNTAIGVFALTDNTIGNNNTATGFFALFSNSTGNNNTATGVEALTNNSTGSNNTASGFDALQNNSTGHENTANGVSTLFSNSIGSNNTANGFAALFSNTTGDDNTATGFQALHSNTTGSLNTANGVNALFNNITGGNNTANGVAALFNNTTGSNNTANGVDALAGNGSGGNNTANGFNALFSNTTGSNNTANGEAALQNNATGNNNTASGLQALNNNTTGSNNAGFGVNALFSNASGNFNVALGVNSLVHNIIGSNNTAHGVNALFNNTAGINNTASGGAALLRNTTGNSNIALGVNAGANLTVGNNNIDIGNPGVAAESNTIRVGRQGIQMRTFIAGIGGTPVIGSSVVVNSSGQLGVAASSERFKAEIKPMNKVSEAILALRPVTFRYKKSIDPVGVPQFGLVAEEVAKVSPDLVVRDAKGEVYAVRYEAVNAMLLNEFLKEHSTMEELKSKIARQEATIAQQHKDLQATAAQQQKQLEALTAGLQKVSAQIEVSNPLPEMVVNNQ